MPLTALKAMIIKIEHNILGTGLKKYINYF